MRNAVVFLIDESSGMNTPIARQTHPAGLGAALTAAKLKCESVATAINAFLAKMQHERQLDIAIAGYRTDEAGGPDIASRWAGPLAGRTFVAGSDLAGNERAVLQRSRKVPQPGGGFEEQTMDFPVWFEPASNGKSPQLGAFRFCQTLIQDWAAGLGSEAGQAFLVHITGTTSADGNPLQAVQAIQALQVGQRQPLVFNIHLGSHDSVPTTAYAANRAFLARGLARDWFDRSSELPDDFASDLRAQGTIVNPGARAVLCNAKMIDLVKFLELLGTKAAPKVDLLVEEEVVSTDGLVRATSASGDAIPDLGDGGDLDTRLLESEAEPPTGELDDESLLGASTAAAMSVFPEAPALVVFVVDRSVADPFLPNLENVSAKLYEQTGALIGMISQFGKGAVDVGIITYGADAVSGEPDVRVGIADERRYVRDTELPSVALRVEPFTEERPNGVGGILSIPRKRFVLVETEPAPALSPEPAFQEVANTISQWQQVNATSTFPPLVIHLTRGRIEQADLQTAVGLLPADGSVVLYHCVITEEPHQTAILPESPDGLADWLKPFWHHSASLLFRDDLSARISAIRPNSRGLAVNGGSDLLLESVRCKITD